MDDDEKEEAIGFADKWNERLVSDCENRRDLHPENYPEVLGLSSFTDDVSLNKLHKEHQAYLSDYEKTYKYYKEIEESMMYGKKASEEEDKFYRFWKTIID